MKLRTIISIVCFFMASIVGNNQAIAQQKRAFLVGISDYGNPREDNDKWKNINGRKDVELMIPVLKKQGFTDILSLTDANATKSNIVNGIKRLEARCRKGDILYLHFSMHGQMVEDLNGDEVDGWDEALCPYDSRPKYIKGVYVGQNHLLDDELEILVTGLRKKVGPQGMVYVILDSCYSGGSMRGEDEISKADIEDECGKIRGGTLGFSSNKEKAEAAKIENKHISRNNKLAPEQSPVYYVEACQPNQSNKEYYRKSPKLQCGSLTYAIISVLGNGKTIDKKGDWTSLILLEMKKMKRNGNTKNTQIPMIEYSK